MWFRKWKRITLTVGQWHDGMRWFCTSNATVYVQHTSHGSWFRTICDYFKSNCSAVSGINIYLDDEHVSFRIDFAIYVWRNHAAEKLHIFNVGIVATPTIYILDTNSVHVLLLHTVIMHWIDWYQRHSNLFSDHTNIGRWELRTNSTLSGRRNAEHVHNDETMLGEFGEPQSTRFAGRHLSSAHR